MAFVYVAIFKAGDTRTAIARGALFASAAHKAAGEPPIGLISSDDKAVIALSIVSEKAPKEFASALEMRFAEAVSKDAMLAYPADKFLVFESGQVFGTNEELRIAAGLLRR